MDGRVLNKIFYMGIEDVLLSEIFLVKKIGRECAILIRVLSICGLRTLRVYFIKNFNGSRQSVRIVIYQ